MTDENEKILSDLRDLLGTEDWTEEERENFLTEGGTICEVEGVVTLSLYVNHNVAQSLSSREKAIALLTATLECLKDGLSDGEIINAKCHLVASKYTPAASVTASEEEVKAVQKLFNC